MNIIDNCVQEIARHAQTLYERINTLPGEDMHVPGMEEAEERLKRWREYAAANDSLVFGKRLAWDGLTRQTALQLMAVEIPGQERQDSPWMLLLGEVLGLAGRVTAGELRQSPHAFNDHKHPFEEIHMLFANTGIKQLGERVGSINDLFIPQAFTDLVRLLLLRLSFVSVDILRAEMELSGRKYPSFIDVLLEGEMLTIFRKYPVMARLMSQFTLFWVEASAQLINALAHDMDLIGKTFEGQRHPGRVSRVECGLSDPHNRGRSVIKLEFETELKLIFKPRDLGIEESFFNLAAQMNTLEDEDMFRILKILNRGSYGWMEYCDPLPCRDEREVVRFYRRSGMLLCVMYLLTGMDLHYENIIAQGEYPVAVDLEVMFQPLPEHKKSEPGEYSVLETSLLPVQIFKDHNGYFSPVGLGGRNFTSANGLLDGAAYGNCVYLNGRRVKPEEYVEDIEAGFKRVYRAILRQRDKFLAAAGPLSVFENKRVRYVYRKTNVYFNILYNSMRPQYLKNGILRSIRMDKISRTLVNKGKKPGHWDIIRLEHEALDRGDIPSFYINTCERWLENENGRVLKNFFTETPLAAVRNLISGMSDDDLVKQCALIRGSFRVQEALIRNSKGQTVRPANDEAQQFHELNREQLLEAVKAIAGYICDRAIITGTSIDWLNTAIGINPYIEMKIMKGNLYNGKAGVCLFLCSCLKILGHHENIKFTQTALVNELIKIMDWHWSEASRNELIGAGKGLGGIIYALVKMCELTGDELLLRKALQLSQAISDRLIENDAQYDVNSGSAGAILGLLALYGACPSDGVLRRAIRCADHLLACRVESANGLKAWKPSGMFIIDNQPVPAFARGASGVALALGRLYEVSGRVRYMRAARVALLYENDILREKKFAWPGLNGQSPGVQLSWSTGAAGICLNRLEAGNILGTGQRDKDLQAALDLIRRADNLGKDNLSWGNFGLIDVLVSASCKLGNDRLYNEALTRAARYFEGFAGFSENVHDLSFFEGISGIGYVLLRLVERRLPSVLAFE